MKMYKKYGLLALLLPMLILGACDKNLPETFKTSDTMTMMEYLEKESGNYSEFLAMLDKSGLYGILNATGTFTGFVPDNEAVTAYLSENGISSVDALEKGQLRELVGTHFLTGEYSTDLMTPGMLRDSTFAGGFVTVKFREGGVNNLLINNRSTIKSRDTECSNGTLHFLDKMLKPVSNSVFQEIEAMGTATIFAQGLRETGLMEMLNKSISEKGYPVNYTVLVETDAMLAEKGIGSLEELIALRSEGGDITDPANKFYQYMAYHCINGLYYSSEFTNKIYQTVGANMVSVDVDHGFRINPVYDEFGDFLSANSFIQEKMDHQASNGVIHELADMLPVVTPRPVVVRNDVLDVPEIRRLRGQDLSKVTFFTKNVERWDSEGQRDEGFYYGGNHCGLNLGSLHMTGYIGTFHFTTEPIVKGEYRLRMKVDSNGEDAFGSFNFYVDGKFAAFADPRGNSGASNVDLGVYTFKENGTHVISIKNVRPGRLTMGCVTFEPTN
ncbi:hypothetical protein FUAX_23530 [Fulvitalea axinellae]|uniref:FAS1 domain-containing protein n=1 Tax=Fulvitalea axinellae TaxID=1182444 RepID=A0AAU9CCR3_9BACT|nr:hypothetical protein FUAX_23530 [Fulvitalea axinellae]